MAILFGVCCIEELKEVPITPLSEIVTVFGGVPGVVCERTLPVGKSTQWQTDYSSHSLVFPALGVYHRC